MTTLYAPTPAPMTLTPPPLARLARIELRKAVDTLAGTGRWLDPSTAWNHLADGTMTATTWAQVGTAAAVWVALPVLAGGWRVLHRPVDV